jgi:hypothetical protein
MSERIVAAQQPNYLPWIGYFNKINKSDIFVFLDDVEYTSGDWINRNRIKTPDGWTWLTVPVTGSTNDINDTEIDQTKDWQEEHRKSFQHNYRNASYYDDYSSVIMQAYDRQWEYLSTLNRFLITEITDVIGFDCEFILASELNIDGTKSERLIDICTSVDADMYFSGTGAKSYMDNQAFQEAGISVEYLSFESPTYPQRFDEFIPDLSVVDMLLNCGAEHTAEIISDL